MSHNEIPNLCYENIPSSFIVKDSWPLRILSSEADMYQSAQGLFGVPEIICSYIVKGPDGKEQSTIDFIPPDSTFWNVFRCEDHEKAIPEDRVHSRHLFKTEGRDLLDASSPKELLEGILHGMIGVWPVPAMHFHQTADVPLKVT